MSVATWLIIAIVGFSLAGVAFFTAIFMFIKMDIPTVIGDLNLSSKTVARKIKAIREANTSNSDRRFRSSKVNLERVMLADDIFSNDSSQKLGSKITEKINDDATERLNNQTTEKPSNNETEELRSYLTEKISDNATEILSDDVTEISSGTTVFLNGTEVLDFTEESTEEKKFSPVAFTVTKSVIVIHTDEVIGKI